MRIAAVLTPVAALVLATACGAAPGPSTATSAPASASSAAPSDPPSASPSPSPSASASSAPGAAPRTTGTPYRYAFPVRGRASYARTHHHYPAADIFAPCGAVAVSPVDGVVLEVNRVDTFDPKINAGATRGGLSVSILGLDGVRYYGSHYSSIDAGIQAGTPVRADQPVAKVGSTGDSGACHVHFGISPACSKTGDWWIRRGVLYPWPYLDSWRARPARSPVADVAAWQSRNGCPTRPLVYP